MSDPHANRPFPRGVLIATGILLTLILLTVGTLRLTGYEPSSEPTGAVLQSRGLHFVDRADGAVVVYDAADESLIKVLEPGSNGFVRGVLRGLARERAANDVGPQPPFELTYWSDGRLTLTDVSTGRMIDLKAFGKTNVAAFAQLLESNDRSATGTAATHHAAIQDTRRRQQGETGDDG